MRFCRGKFWGETIGFWVPPSHQRFPALVPSVCCGFGSEFWVDFLFFFGLRGFFFLLIFVLFCSFDATFSHYPILAFFGGGFGSPPLTLRALWLCGAVLENAKKRQKNAKKRQKEPTKSTRNGTLLWRLSQQKAPRNFWLLAPPFPSRLGGGRRGAVQIKDIFWRFAVFWLFFTHVSP